MKRSMFAAVAVGFSPACLDGRRAGGKPPAGALASGPHNAAVAQGSATVTKCGFRQLSRTHVVPAGLRWRPALAGCRSPSLVPW